MVSRKIALALALLLAVSAGAALQREERVIAGGSTDSMEVRHLVLRGTNEEIGRALAEIARQRYGVRADPARDPLRTRAQRRYIESAYPILAERMRGVAAAFGHRLEDDAWDHSQLGFTELQAGCSIVHLPPQSTADGQSAADLLVGAAENEVAHFHGVAGAAGNDALLLLQSGAGGYGQEQGESEGDFS